MKRIEAILNIINKHPSAAIIFSNGLTASEGCWVSDRTGNFYMRHAMGEALSVGIGLRQYRKDLEVVVIEGDGNAIMGLASTTLLPIEGLYHYVLKNDIYETTGGQSLKSFTYFSPHSCIIKIEPGVSGESASPEPEITVKYFIQWLKNNQCKY